MRPEIMMLNIFEREGWYERRLVEMEAEVERLQEKHNELRRLDEAEDSCAELARMLKTVEAEVERLTAEVTDLREGNQIAANTLAPLIGERDRYKKALEVATKRLQLYRHGDTLDQVERIVRRCGVCGGSEWRGMRDSKRGVIAYACPCGHSWECVV